MRDSTKKPACSNFYPRPPRGGRQKLYGNDKKRYQFLSTPSARRATTLYNGDSAPEAISIHALREEGDLDKETAKQEEGISIHALREEGDGKRAAIPEYYWNFYPRPPRGGRLPSNALPSPANIFLSTPSARRATTKIIL